MGYHNMWSTCTHLTHSLHGKTASVMRVMSCGFRNSSTITHAWSRLSQVAQATYARFKDKGYLVPKIKHGQQADRYEAVNSYNDATLEVRVFRGSLRKQRILSAIEFLHAATEYTRDMRINPKDKQLSWFRFMAYVLDNQDKYGNFTQVALKALETTSVGNSTDEDN